MVIQIGKILRTLMVGWAVNILHTAVGLGHGLRYSGHLLVPSSSTTISGASALQIALVHLLVTCWRLRLSMYCPSCARCWCAWPETLGTLAQRNKAYIGGVFFALPLLVCVSQWL